MNNSFVVYFQFKIQGRLPGLNEIIASAQHNRFGYGAFKKKNTQICEEAILQVPRVHLAVPIQIEIDWHEPNKKRDPDNIMAGTKFICDALVTMGVVPNDTQEFVKRITHQIYLDKINPRIEVRLLNSNEPA